MLRYNNYNCSYLLQNDKLIRNHISKLNDNNNSNNGSNSNIFPDIDFISESNIDDLNSKHFNKHTVLHNSITISYTSIDLNGNYLSKASKEKSYNVNNKGNGYDNLENAISNFNSQSKGSKYISTLDILFGPGATWVMPPEKRDLIDKGNAFGKPIIINVGNKKTKIQNVRIIGLGQGTSTVRGSCLLNIHNLQSLNIIKGTDYSYADGAAQFANRLILQNLFCRFLSEKFKRGSDMINPSIESSDTVFWYERSLEFILWETDK